MISIPLQCKWCCNCRGSDGDGSVSKYDRHGGGGIDRVAVVLNLVCYIATMVVVMVDTRQRYKPINTTTSTTTTTAITLCTYTNHFTNKGAAVTTFNCY